ncbi:mannitol-1-phosphate 5-dehydrogenase [Pseudolysinimonas yzui]|uniref:Mannitol-1-phosphate 5-dehydrogenase n=1 Tax=Pseudolysinimonas yzui TaxID=2708254 RepID=A0A8J3GS38_9MICO|nr:mannitol-1-phosphate 5-dehydrogenase [Pseudolysinimonas yzui]GHF20617.1 mannitol-1-phosphate 5-dehydrogenase [Pseudolysinimonas yzui]
MTSPQAVHFGAGNIGRGFIGLLLHEAGYEVVFADVNADLIGTLQSTPSYRVIEAGAGGVEKVVTGYRAIDSNADPDGLVAAIASADVVTTAVGPNILRFVAPAIAAGILARPVSARPLAVMACENALGATALLRAEVEKHAAADAVGLRAIFANTAVDRIVPEQSGAGLDVLVEPYCEWAVESTPFGSGTPDIPGAHFVPDLAPYIERKLFTVNTGHATTAYYGRLAGHATIAAALADAAVRAAVEAVLAETAAFLVAKHDFPAAEQRAYLEKTLERFSNPAIDDSVERVGRQPIRKLSRHERFVGPASEIAESGGSAEALLGAMGAALRFDAPGDEEAVKLQGMLRDGTDIVATVMGLAPSDALYSGATATVESVRASL